MNSTCSQIIIALVLTVTGCATAAPEPQPQAATLSVEQMQDTIDLVEASVAQVHLSAVEAPPAEFESAVAKARARAIAPLPEAEFFIVLSEMTAALHDAHTHIELDPADEEGGRLDLPILWLTEGPVVIRDAGELRRGDLVVRVGSRAAAEVLAELTKIVPHENEGHVRAAAPELVVRELVLRALGLLDADDVIDVVVERDGVEHTLTLTLGDASEPVEDQPWFGYTVDTERGYGLFWLDRCELSTTYLSAVDSFFAAVVDAGIDHVIVDLSRNPGGDSAVAFAFLRHVDPGYLSFSVDQRISAPTLDAFPIYTDPAFQQALVSIGVDPMSEVWSMPGEFLKAGIEMPLPPISGTAHYSGQVDAIIGPQTFSSGHLFAIMIADTHLGELAGEPTGNETSFQGQIVRFPVPGTSLQLVVSSARNRRPDPAAADAEALEPTIPTPWTREQIRDGANIQLEALLAE